MTSSNPELPSKVVDHQALFERLQAGNTLVTGNSRLARVLTGKYNQWRTDQGDRQWPSPTILAWNPWLDQLWESASLQGVERAGYAVPNNRQLTSLWESTLRNEQLRHNLLRPESLANQLRDTRRLVVDWQLGLKDPAWFSEDNENCSAFYLWNKAFESLCKKHQWLAAEDRTALLCNALETSRLRVSGNIDLLGFDELNPGQATLLAALAQNGVNICQLGVQSHQQTAVLWRSKDSQTELQQMARWVRHWVEQEPQASIAVVVPDLQNRRHEIERQLAEVLTPGSCAAGHQAQPWNFSMGIPLTRVPMVAAAFNLLKLLDTNFDIQDAGRVLRSPWLLGADSERNNRALLEKRLREKYPRQLKLEQLAFRASEIKKYDHQRNELPPEQHQPQPWNSPQLSIALQRLGRFGRESNGPRAASGWAEAFDQLLASLGWPLDGDSQDEHSRSAAWQVLQAWREALCELASLDATIPGLGCKAAIRQLRQICQDRIFQPQSPAARIQVLGLYEISGLRFDHLWVVGLHNKTWPASARPNPFIPGTLQRRENLPNSSPRRELEVAGLVTERLLQTAPDCVFSYPGQMDGEDVLPSPLLKDIANIDDSDLPGWRGEDWQDKVFQAEKPQIDPLQMPGTLGHDTARGGSSILKHQALCPFRAFASNRLGADGLQTPADGISPMLHGSLIHSVLEYFWQETKSQSALLKLGDEALSARVRKHVKRAVEEEHGLTLRHAFRQVEADRLQRLALDFLEVDKTRSPFEVIGLEEKTAPQIEGQPIRLVIDRIDRLSSGEQVIIDYKTGKVDPKKWLGERPEEPQLPLYAISTQPPPDVLMFGVVRDDGCEYKGVVAQKNLPPGLPSKDNTSQELIDAGQDMPATIKAWRRTLHDLMTGFLAGKAEVDPKNGLNTCKDTYCQLHSLCRVGELVQRHKHGGSVK